MKYIFLILFLHIQIFFSFAQTLKNSDSTFEDSFYEADGLMEEKNFQNALHILLSLFDTDSTNANINYLIGICYLHTATDKDLSVKYLENALHNVDPNAQSDSHKERKSPPDALLYLGKAYHIIYKFDDAVEMFNEFKLKTDKVTIKNKKDLLAESDRYIQICKNAKEIIKFPLNLKAKNLGDSINSHYSDHSPVISADESILIFTSKREGSTGGLICDDGQYFEDIYICNKENQQWSVPKGISQNINSSGHEASIGLSSNGQNLLIYKDDNNNGNIYLSRLTGNEWSVPVAFEEPVNSKYNEKDASISPDESYLYFSSNRPGGYGGYDIYMSKKLPNEKWGLPINMGSKINTPYDELSPFIHPDEKTLIYSSQGHNSIGGFDVFYTTVNVEDATTTESLNIGYPINTTDDDIFYVITPDGKRAYYSSYMKGGYGYTDIYMIELAESFDKPLAVASGIIKKEFSKNSSNTTITVTDITDPDNSKFIGTYTPNSNTGKYIFILASERKYQATYKSNGYKNHDENIYISKESAYTLTNSTIPLNTIILKSTKKTDKLDFDKNSSEFDNDIKTKLQNICNYLKENQDALLSISDKTANNTKRKKTNEERLNHVISFLVSNGINKNRIKIGIPDAEDYGYELIILDREENKNQILSDDYKQKNIDKKSVKNTSGKWSKTLVLHDILFAYDSYIIPKEEYQHLINFASFLKNNPALKIKISGFTDSKGSDEYNEKLSLKRTGSIKNILLKNGVNESNIIIQKFGKTSPIGKNENADGSDNAFGRALNRRVEFTVVKNNSSDIRCAILDSLIELQCISVTKFSKTINNKYTIQISALSKQKKNAYFRFLNDVKEFLGKDNLYRYATGEYPTEADAKAALKKVKEKGYEGFIIEIEKLEKQ